MDPASNARSLAGWILLIFSASTLFPVSAHAGRQSNIEDEIFAFAEVAPGFYRGGQPTEKGYEHLKALGVKTIINFRHEKDQIKWDKKQAKQNGMRYISLPWTIYGMHDREVVKQFLEIVKDPAAQPIFMHCRRGSERTSVMAALYYLQYEGLSEEGAFQKATEGFPIRWYWMPFVKKQYDSFKEAARPAR